LENEDYAASWGPASKAKYLNSLRPAGAFSSRYSAVSHLSAGNYVALTSGQAPTPPFQSDCQSYAACVDQERALGGRSVADQIEGVGGTWAGYMGSMSRPCLHPSTNDTHDPYQTGYATRHDPFVYYPPIIDNAARCNRHVVNYSVLESGLPVGGAVPNLSLIVPDTCDDGHDAPCADGRPGGLVQADEWLRRHVPRILASSAYRDGGALFITFDEASTSDNSGCCASGISGNGLDGGGRIGLLMLSPLARVGHASDSFHDHYSLLRTIEDGLGISEHLGRAAAPKEGPMAELFSPPH
jgi:hypothetical protein